MTERDIDAEMAAVAQEGKLAVTTLGLFIKSAEALNELLPLLDEETRAVLQPFVVPFQLVGRCLVVLGERERANTTTVDLTAIGLPKKPPRKPRSTK